MDTQATDNQIIELFFSRDDGALVLSDKEYGTYGRAISHRILNDSQDVEECVNEMLFQA